MSFDSQALSLFGLWRLLANESTRNRGEFFEGVIERLFGFRMFIVALIFGSCAVATAILREWVFEFFSWLVFGEMVL